MTDSVALPIFHLHFDGEETRGHTVPGSVLAQAIQALQRSVHLLALAREGRDFKERLRIPHDLERKYALVFKLPEAGGYDLPYVIGGAAEKMFDVEDVRATTELHVLAMKAVREADLPSLRRAIPVAGVRRQFISAIRDMQPRQGTGLVVSIEDYRREKLIDGSGLGSRLALLVNEPASPRIHPRWVTGRLDGIDFQSRTLTLLLPTGRRLNCAYREDFEPTLLDNPREWIQLRGEAIIDENDTLKAVNNVTEIVEVDDSPAIIARFDIDGRPFAAARPISFAVKFDPNEGLYTATGDFHMLASGETRAELESEIVDTLALLWREYADSSARNFSTDALELRDSLTRAFAGAADGS
jgi:hypothetical protein